MPAREALRATVGTAKIDVPTGTWTNGQFLRYNATGGPNSTPILDTAAAAGGDFSGPAGAVSGNLVSFNGATGKLGQDSGVAASLVTAHASRHLPAGADTMFPGTWAAADFPIWTGAAWSPRRRGFLRLTTDQAAIAGTSGLVAIAGLTLALPRAGTYFFTYNIIVSNNNANAVTTSVNLAYGTAPSNMAASVIVMGGLAATNQLVMNIVPAATSATVTTGTIAVTGDRFILITGIIVATSAQNLTVSVGRGTLVGDTITPRIGSCVVIDEI